MDKNKNQYPLVEPIAKDYETLSRDDLHNQLQIFVAELLEHNFEKLCNMIYRHDVKEEKFHEALGSGTIAEQSAQIADLVLDREMEKVRTRQAYKHEKNKNKLDR